MTSRPSRARGLKPIHWRYRKENRFASITGAWIETGADIAENESPYSRPSRARGLKQIHS